MTRRHALATRRALLVLGSGVLGAALLLSGCAASRPNDATPASGAPASVSASALRGEVTVFAAASLRLAFDEIAQAFERQHPGVDVQPILYDGSSTLVTQLLEGAHADVLATADESSMQNLVDAGLAAKPRIFATNTLVVAVPAGNPGGVTGLDDLDHAVTVLCAPEVPCGKASTALLDAAGVTVTPASLEQNVTAVLQKVSAGEADAGLVYATDVHGDDSVQSFTPEGAADVVNRYPVVALEGAGEAGAAFAAFARGAEAQRILADLGFGHP